jgi:hypothetical protein
MMDLFDKDLILPSLFSAIAGLFGWLVGKRKENVEVDSNEIANTKEIIEMWKVTAKEMKEEVAELKEKIESLTTEVHKLRAENVDLRTKLGLTNEDNENKH